MLEISDLKLPVDHAPEEIASSVAVALKAPHGEVLNFKVHRRAIDARRGRVLFIYTLHVVVRDETAALANYRREMAKVSVLEDRRYTQLSDITVRDSAPGLRPVVVGTGPCGLFCALLLARHGLKPIVLERGKAAGPRARDVTGFWRRGLEFNPD